MTSVSLVDWKIAPLLHQFLPQVAGVGDVAVVGHGKAAAGEIGIERLHVAQAGAAGGRVANMPGGHHARQLGNRFTGREVVGDMAQAAAGEEFLRHRNW